jgi:hypothetical protein
MSIGFEKVRRRAAAHGSETEIGDCLYHVELFLFSFRVRRARIDQR